MSRNRYPRDTGPEWASFPVTSLTTGAPITAGVEYALLPVGSTAAKTWTAAVIRDGKTGAIINGLAVGFYEVSARITAPPDTVVVDCGTFEVY